MVQVEFQGQLLSLPRDQLERARVLAAARAGSSSRLRDLALLLDRALTTTKTVSLRRAEARQLEQLTANDPALQDVHEALISSTSNRAA